MRVAMSRFAGTKRPRSRFWGHGAVGESGEEMHQGSERFLTCFVVRLPDVRFQAIYGTATTSKLRARSASLSQVGWRSGWSREYAARARI